MKRLDGALNFAHAAQWFAQADELATAGSLDLSGVTHCDSAGVALLLDLHRRAHAQGRTLTLSQLPTAMRDLLRFFGVDKMLGIA